MDISPKKPALKLKGEQRPAIAIPQRRTAPVIVAPPDPAGALPRDRGPGQSVAGRGRPRRMGGRRR